MRALLIANQNDADAGYVGDRFRFHGYSFTECFREHPDEWPDLDGHDLVLLLGSEWSVYWPEIAHKVAAEASLIRAAHERGVPQFGICFGNQSMAHALGGTVERAREPEIGWYDVVSDVPDVIAEGPWLQWHYDVVTVPPAATELARSSVGPQAWQLGRQLLHPVPPRGARGDHGPVDARAGRCRAREDGLVGRAGDGRDPCERERQPRARRAPRRLVRLVALTERDVSPEVAPTSPGSSRRSVQGPVNS